MKITEIIVHCAATRPEWMADKPLFAKVAEIKRWHLARGWSDIGYHHLIDRDGERAAGRPMGRNGAHVRGRNRGTVGVCLIGGHGGAESDSFSDHFTTAQGASLRELIGKLHREHGAVPVTGHNQFAAKACPCFNAPEWFKSAPDVSEQKAPMAAAAVYRWRLAEIRDLASKALGE